jgi:tRNA dimethylallyltransferase
MAEIAIRAGTKAVLIAGPTASGKSRLAVELAQEHGGLVVNADSMQVYSELRILTARPGAEDEAQVPHRLYGHVAAAERYSVGRWLGDIAAELERAWKAERLPIVTGGTGLYFRALTEGLADVPAIPADIRETVQRSVEGEAGPVMHRRLAEIDPEDAAEIRPSDRARILRALEVFEATGRSLAAWRARPTQPILKAGEVTRLVLDPDRMVLHERISSRADAMLQEGAMEEVRTLAELKLSPDLPAMKAIGVRELLDHLEGKTSLDEAIAGMKTETRRYAKRQMTWFRTQMPEWDRMTV